MSRLCSSALRRAIAKRPAMSSTAEVALKLALTAGMNERSTAPGPCTPPCSSSSQPRKASAAAETNALKTKKLRVILKPSLYPIPPYERMARPLVCIQLDLRVPEALLDPAHDALREHGS